MLQPSFNTFQAVPDLGDPGYVRAGGVIIVKVEFKQATIREKTMGREKQDECASHSR
jgi:hypothetical protein